MVKRFAVIFVVCLFATSIFAGGAFAATAKKASEGKWTRHISGDVNVDGAGFDLYRAPSKAISKYYAPSGAKLTCDDIMPEVGIIIQHDQIGDTWYDFQKNGSIGRMISVTDDGYRHFSWHYTDHEYPPGPRYVDANCKNPADQYVGQTHADGDGQPLGTNPGYCNQTHEHDGVSVIIHHRTGPASYPWNTTITMDDILCGGFFTRHWDIPDAINGASSGERGMWPKGEVCYDPVGDEDYVHVVMTEGNTAGGVPCVLAWVRTHRIVGDAMVCEACLNGLRTAYTVPINTDMGWNGMFPAIDHFDTSCSITPVVKVSPVSKKVAIVYMHPSCDGSCDYMSDIYYIESTNNGEDWLSDCANWPPTRHKVIEYGCGTPNERAYSDLNATYDYEDKLHIVWVTCGFDPTNPGYYQPGVARLYHWSEEHGISTIHSAIWEGTDPGAHNVNIAKMSISAKDPIYHPGGEPDSVYLYCIWTQFDTADQAANDMTNGDIYGVGSFNGGDSWGPVKNLTKTKTPGCNPGECVSEHWSSLAQNMYNGDLHIQYICDLDAGSAIQDGSEWMEVPVYYLHLTEWPVDAECRTTYRIVDPEHWYHPKPLKVIPGQNRTLIFELENCGNANCAYSLSSDHACIQASGGGNLVPGQAVTLTATLNAGGACVNTFIAGSVIITCDDQTHRLRVHAVVANDYYECPGPETADTLDNGLLTLYKNANCEEWVHYYDAVFDTTYEVFFAGGMITATTSDGDTVVGRFMREDYRSIVRDKLYEEQCEPDWEPHFWIEYTKHIHICSNHLPPPYHFKWWWWNIDKQIKLFKEDAPWPYRNIVVVYYSIEWGPPPLWWPDQTPFTSYENTYIGAAEDIDCPFDTMLSENGRNLAGYDAVNHIAYQRGWDYTGAHPQYNDFYCGLALADGGMPGESTVPYATHNVRNNEYLYPQGGWGWNDQELYELAATAPVGQVDFPDSAVDRAQVFTAQMIPGGTDTTTKAFFTLIKVVAPNGLDELQEIVDSARAIVERERALGGIPAICGDVTGDYVVDLGDVVFLLNYLFKNDPPGTQPAPKCPIARGDVNSDGIIDLGDVVTLLNYLFKNDPPGSQPDPRCPGIKFYRF